MSVFVQGHKTDSVLLLTERMHIAILVFDPALCLLPHPSFLSWHVQVIG